MAAAKTVAAILGAITYVWFAKGMIDEVRADRDITSADKARLCAWAVLWPLAVIVVLGRYAWERLLLRKRA
jgi:hypothetical protein